MVKNVSLKVNHVCYENQASILNLANESGVIVPLYAVWEQNGDLNGDGVLNASDLVILKKFLLTNDDSLVADLNGDNIADIRDLVHLKKLLAEAE